MSTLKVNTIQNTSGASSSTPAQIEQGRAKIWASIDGYNTPSFNDSYNCSSLTDGGEGDWILNFDITMGSTNYCAVGMSENWEGTNKEILKTNNQSVTDFVYSSELLKKVKKHI